MNFVNVKVIGHELHHHQRLFLEAWMAVKDPNAGNDHIVIPEVYKCLARIQVVIYAKEPFFVVTHQQHAQRFITLKILNHA